MLQLLTNWSVLLTYKVIEAGAFLGGHQGQGMDDVCHCQNRAMSGHQLEAHGQLQECGQHRLGHVLRGKWGEVMEGLHQAKWVNIDPIHNNV